MRIAIRDSGFLTALRPLDVAGFLSSKGWRLNDTRPQLAQYWQKGTDYEVLLPLDRRVDGFAVRMAELLDTVERAEQQDQSQIINRVREGASDTIRIGVEGDDVADGTISVSDGTVLVNTGKALVWSAACSAVRPRPVFARRRPAEANAYLKRVRLGQTEVGSFAIKLLSPVAPMPQRADGVIPANLMPHTAPFERRATEMLSTGLNAATSAADDLTTGGDLTRFDDFVSRGLSANLCDAIGDMSASLGAGATLSVSIGWSWRRPYRNEIERQFAFTPDRIEIIREAGRVLKEFAPREEFEMVGTVVRLERGETDLQGRAVVRTYFDNGYKLVGIVLTEEPYAIATKAHQDRALVACLGELVREGRTYDLLNPRAFRIITNDINF